MASSKSWWDGVAEYTKTAQEKGLDPTAWAMHLSSAIASNGEPLPSPELTQMLASHICWENHHVPLAWKYLDKALSANLASPMLLIAILASRVIPSRRSKPVAYRLYMELVRRHAFSFASQIKSPNFKKIMVSIDDVLHLSHAFGIQASEPGVLVIEFVFCILWQILDATLDDEGFQELIPEKNSRWATRPQDMELDGDGNFDEKRMEYSEKIQKVNCVIAIELIAECLQHRLLSRLLCLARENMPSHWRVFTQCLQLLVEKSMALRNSKTSPETFLQLISDTSSVYSREANSTQNSYAANSSGLLMSRGGRCQGAGCSSLWIPIDLYLEDCIDGTVAATNAIELLSGLVKALQAINKSTWHDAFLNLWMASLRLVQRERDPHEGPVPRLDSRLSMLLSITTLSVADIIEEEVNSFNEPDCTDHRKEEVRGNRRRDLVSCLQMLGDYESLLVPPLSVVSAANQAAGKAMMFVSALTSGSGYFEGNVIDKTISCAGSLWHLIVEACISRNLLSTSAYFWPGYVKKRINQIPHALSGQVYSWSTLMKGASLTSSMVNILVATPASRILERDRRLIQGMSQADYIC